MEINCKAPTLRVKALNEYNTHNVHGDGKCYKLFNKKLTAKTYWTGKRKSETRMTASVLKQDPNTWKVQKNAAYYDKTQHANFRGNPLYRSIKITLKQQRNAETYKIWDTYLVLVELFCYAVLVSSACN